MEPKLHFTTVSLSGGRPVLRPFESDVIEEFRSRFEFNSWTDLDVLAYARHHGAPTRLLDWSRNALVGLWFAVSDRQYDSHSATVFQINLLTESKSICLATGFSLEYADTCKCGKPAHLFSSPARIKRTERQQSIFTVATFNDAAVLTPLDKLGLPDSGIPIRKYFLGKEQKPLLRRLLSQLGLDAYSIYGDPDSLGKSLSNILDLNR